MKVKIISIPNCAATPPTLSLVEKTAKEIGVAIDLEHIVVNTPEEANKHRLVGSPTVQVNGFDIEPEVRSINQFGVT